MIPLIDRLMRPKRRIDKEAFNAVAPVIRNAKKFIFDAASSHFLGELLWRYPKEILSAHEWARAPFPDCWIEIDHAAYYEGARFPVTADADHADSQFGMLVHNGWAYPAAATKAGGASLAIWRYGLHQPSSFEHELEMAQLFGTSRLTYRMALLGYSGTADDMAWWEGKAAMITRSHRMEISPVHRGLIDRVSVERRQNLLRSSAGDLKLVLAMLLLVTRPHRNMTIAEEAPRRVIHKGKATVLMPHSSIRLHVSHDDPVRRYLEHMPTGIHRAEHDVRGHWAQNRAVGRGCAHDWQPVDINHYECTCGAKRWWRRNHVRGSGPHKATDYEVTK